MNILIMLKFEVKYRFFLWSISISFLTGVLSNNNFYNVLEYFPEVNGDASEISWAHGVNSQKELQQAIESGVMMLEADISSSLQNGVIIPIMAHPPKTTSDIILQAWLEKSISVRAGIKLDFKDLEALKPSLVILKAMKKKINKPLWLNSDIVGGSIDPDAKTLDALRFLNLCKDIFPESTLSIGWIIDWSKRDEGRGYYSWGHILKMIQIIQFVNITQPITFPIRAVFIRYSLPQLKFLLDIIPGSTLTVWSANDDIINIQNLVYLRSIYKRDQIFFDLPHPLLKDFSDIKNKNFAHTNNSLLRNYDFNKLWIIKNNQSMVYIGSESVVVPMDGSELLSKKIYQNSISINGRISFIGSLGNWNLTFILPSIPRFHVSIVKLQSSIGVMLDQPKPLISMGQFDCLIFDIIYNRDLNSFLAKLYLQCSLFGGNIDKKKIFKYYEQPFIKLPITEKNSSADNYMSILIESKPSRNYIILEQLNINEGIMSSINEEVVEEVIKNNDEVIGNNHSSHQEYNIVTLVVAFLIYLINKR